MVPMRQVTRWWWVRHAPVRDQPHIYGTRDVAADVSDRDSFARLAQLLPRDAVWVCSHLTRTQQTVAALAETGHPVSEPLIEPGLGEQNFGEWQGLTWDEIGTRGGAAPGHKFWVAPAGHRPPGGETFLEVIERVAAVIARLTASHGGRDIVAVAHGGSIRAALAHALGIDPEVALGFAADNLAATRIDHVSGPGLGGEWRVAFVNMRA